MPPANCAVALAALKYLEKHPEIVTRVNDLASFARKQLKSKGMSLIDSTVPIIPIYTYEEINTLTKAKEIYDAGVYLNPVLPPATNPGECLLRTSYMASLTEPLIDEAVDIIAKNIGSEN